MRPGTVPLLVLAASPTLPTRTPSPSRRPGQVVALWLGVPGLGHVKEDLEERKVLSPPRLQARTPILPDTLWVGTRAVGGSWLVLASVPVHRLTAAFLWALQGDGEGAPES